MATCTRSGDYMYINRGGERTIAAAAVSFLAFLFTFFLAATTLPLLLLLLLLLLLRLPSDVPADGGSTLDGRQQHRAASVSPTCGACASS